MLDTFWQETGSHVHAMSTSPFRPEPLRTAKWSGRVRDVLKFEIGRPGLPCSIPLFNTVYVTIYLLISVFFGTYWRLDLLLGSARGCPGQHLHQPVWLERCNFLVQLTALSWLLGMSLNCKPRTTTYWLVAMVQTGPAFSFSSVHYEFTMAAMVKVAQKRNRPNHLSNKTC